MSSYLNEKKIPYQYDARTYGNIERTERNEMIDSFHKTINV